MQRKSDEKIVDIKEQPVSMTELLPNENGFTC